MTPAARPVAPHASTATPAAFPARALAPPAWQVLCDFDGTITVDVTDALLERFARTGWEQLEHDWLGGHIGARECMAGQIALLDCSAEELEAHLAGIGIDPRFEAFLARLGEAGVPVCIVSDGLDHAIAAVLQRHAVGPVPVYASRLVQTGPRSWALEFPHGRPDCDGATCKCAVAAGLPQGAPPAKLLLVGDGRSDTCVAGQASMTFARRTLLAHCRSHGLPHRPAADFGQVIAAWEALAAGATESLAEAVAHEPEFGDSMETPDV